MLARLDLEAGLKQGVSQSTIALAFDQLIASVYA